MHSIFETMRRYHMIEAGMHVIAGVSGGADSVCLLLALCEYRRLLPFDLTAVHVEHGLRGEESLGDAAFTQELCGRLGVLCRTVHIQADLLARREGISVEEAGRRGRYRIFGEIKEECGAHRIAVAHNRNDQAETVLWNLARGSGLRGLGGMSPVRGDIIRPLLFTDRAGIERILREAGLSWRTDRTNLQQDYTRNRIRLSVLPQMERELNGRAAEHIADAADRLRQVQEYLDRMTDRAEDDCVCADGESVCIVLEAFRGQEELIQKELLRRAVQRCGGLRDFGSVHVEAFLHLCGLDCGREICLPGGVRAVREAGIVRLSRAGGARQGAEQEPPEPVSVPVPGSFRAGGWRGRTELCGNSPELMRQIFEENKYTKWFSYDTIDNNALSFRTRRQGDYLVVSRGGGRKKLKDYLIDVKVPRERRDSIWLLASGSHVLWVPGYRISEAVKVTEQTRRVMKVQLEDETV